MCTLVPKTLEITFISDYQTHGLLLQMLSMKYKATNRKDSFTFLQENTINEMVQTIFHRFNTHVKRLSSSASMVIIIITRLLATSRIITQYFNHLLLFNFSTSPLKIDELLSTFQVCHSWLGTFGN